MLWKLFATVLLVNIFMMGMDAPPTFGIFATLLAVGIFAAIVDRIIDV